MVNEENSLNEIAEALNELHRKNHPQLDNGIDQAFPQDSGKEDDIMAYRYRERVTLPNGTRVWATGDTKDELFRTIANLLAPTVETPVAPSKPLRPLSEVLWEKRAERWYNTFHLPKIRPKTHEKDWQLMTKFVIPAFKGRSIATITTAEIQEWLGTKSDYSASTLRDMMALMRAIFSDAVDDGVIQRNPMNSDRITNPSTKPPNERRSLTMEEQADIIAHLDELKEPNARRLMGLLMFTGLRPSEIYGLKWSDIDQEKMMIHIQRGMTFSGGKPTIAPPKTKRSDRSVPISPQLNEYLSPFKDDGFVICMKDGGSVSSEGVVRKLWERIKKTIDLHGMTPYMGRHTFATNMSRAGVPLRTAMSLMGHADERMLLRRYTHVEEQDILDANEKMETYLRNVMDSRSVTSTQMPNISNS